MRLYSLLLRLYPASFRDEYGPELWRRYMNAVRQQATHLARQGRLEILRKGQPVDPKNFKGVVRLRLPMPG